MTPFLLRKIWHQVQHTYRCPNVYLEEGNSDSTSSSPVPAQFQVPAQFHPSSGSVPVQFQATNFHSRTSTPSNWRRPFKLPPYHPSPLQHPVPYLETFCSHSQFMTISGSGIQDWNPQEPTPSPYDFRTSPVLHTWFSMFPHWN